MVKIFIVILNFNGWNNTISCLKSLEKIDIPVATQIEIVVIDNGSENDSVKKIKEKMPKSKLIEIKENLGFTGGNNFGIKYAIDNGTDYIVILNNDTRADKDMIKNLYESIKDDDRAGSVLPKIYFEKGYEFHKGRYRKEELGRVIWYTGGIMDWGNLIGKNRGVDEVDSGQYDRREEIELATGCCFMIRSDVLKKVGMFNEKYFLYYEDSELSERIKRAGYKIIYEPSAVLWHKNAESSGGSGSDLQDYYITRNRLLFGMTYAPLRTKIALIRESLGLLTTGRKWQKKGVRDFFLGKFGRGSFPI